MLSFLNMDADKFLVGTLKTYANGVEENYVVYKLLPCFCEATQKMPEREGEREGRVSKLC